MAKTHADLGFGHMAARREKVSRWESGRVVPSPTTQLAIAHIHHVPHEEVVRRSWPDWLALAVPHATLADQPWTPMGTRTFLHQADRVPATQAPRQLALTGRALAEFAHSLVAGVVRPLAFSREGLAVTVETLALIEARVDALRQMQFKLTPTALRPAIRGEYRLLTALLAEGGYGKGTGIRLLELVMRTAGLGGAIGWNLAEYADAESYYLAAVRAAAATGVSDAASAFLGNLALVHAHAGTPGEALGLIEAARTITPSPSPRLRAFLQARQARAHASRFETDAGTRALDHAAATLASIPAHHDVFLQPFVGEIGADWLALTAGTVWQHMGHAERALEHFSLVLDKSSPGHTQGTDFPFSARYLLSIADAQLTLGYTESATTHAHWAEQLFSGIPPALRHELRQGSKASSAGPKASAHGPRMGAG
ncbi:hypothetical protein [Kitasatospora sp. NPDC089509]|uniref:hypothetical protein n=1 Tax=Kitasatospora sp. NPDC089509 TaxID=3364079 RepID=UPI00380ED482